MRMTQLAGRQVSVLAIGSSYFGGDCPEGKAWEILDKYAEEGGTLIDTARVYGRMSEDIPGAAEQVIGRWLAKRSDAGRFFISSKGGHPSVRSMDKPRLDRDSLAYDVRASLDGLGVPSDIYWLHRDDRSRPVGDIVESMNLFLEEGYFRTFGASNRDPDRIEEANAYAAAHGTRGFSGTQVQFSLAHARKLPDPTCRMMTGEVFRHTMAEGIFCFAYSSQAKALFTVLAQKGEEGLSPKARERYLTDGNRRIFRTLTRLSEEKGVPVSALSLAWLTSQPFPVFPIVGASRPEQLDGLSLAGDVTLTESERKELRDMEAE